MSAASAPFGSVGRRVWRVPARVLISVLLAIALAGCDNDRAETTDPAAEDAAAAGDPIPALGEEPPPVPSAAPPDPANPDVPRAAEPPVAEAVEAAAADVPPEAGPIAEAEPEPPPLAAQDLADDEEILARLAAADVDAGWRFGQRCGACHSLAIDPPPGGDRLGPPLAAVARNLVASTDDFDYSPALLELRGAGITWNIARLDVFLADPAAAAPGTTMSIPGIASPEDRINVIAYLVDLADQSAAAAMGIGTTPGAGAETIAERIEQANPAAGEALASARCGACHLFTEAGAALAGPNLYDIVGKTIGAGANYGYSAALRTLNAAGEIWTLALLDAFLQSPSLAIPGTRMGFTGIADATDREDIIAYLRLLADEPLPLTAGIGVPRPGFQPATFTAEQAALGGAYYELYRCAACHGPDLRGRVDIGGLGDAPTLTGPNFERRWYPGSVEALFSSILTRKDLPAGVAAEHSAAIVAYILRQNGFRSGGAALPADAVLLETIGFFQ